LSWMSAFFLDILQGLATLKMFGRSREQAENIREISSHYGSTTMEVLRTAFQTSLVMEWAATAATALAALEISLRIMSGNLAFERGLAALLLTPEFFLPLRQMALKYHSGTGGRAAADRLFAILEHPSTAPGTLGALTPGTPGALRMPAITPGTPGVCFENVSFAYAGGQRPALDGFTLKILAGQTVALVGATGAGKSTAANLLLRFIEPTGGQILIHDQPLVSIERTAWLEQVGWVPQRPYLFHGTVAENLRLARPGASQEQLQAAAQAANAAEFIERLPQGYATRLGEQGARLSGGQRQRIAIARAFLKDAPFLILDEATAYLDRENETLIHEALQRLMRQRTVLIIAHRLKLAYQADQIALMEAGRVIEIGKHGDLLARSGRYQQLAAAYERGAW
jgi:ABC-type transport system involved in cytochrome bd biosynthesis fused ATPase/permease subunit